MEFPLCKVKSIKADIVEGVITMAFTTDLTDDSLETSNDLSMYVDKDMGKVELRIVPQQPPLKGLIPEKAEETGGEDAFSQRTIPSKLERN